MADSDLYREFGRKLSNLRNGAGLTQAEMARRVGLSRASLANIERGEQRVYLHQLLGISEALGINSVDELLPMTGYRTPRRTSDVTVSGDRLSKMQERKIKELVSSIASTSRQGSR